MIFKTIEDDFGKLKIQPNGGLKEFFNGDFFKAKSVLGDDDIQALRAYNTELSRVIGYTQKNGEVIPVYTSAQTAFNRTMLDASDAAMAMAESAEVVDAKTGQMAVNLDKIPKTSKAATLGLKALSLAGNMLTNALVGIIVDAVVGYFVDLSHQVENTREAAEGFSNTISEFNGSLKENKDTLSTLNKRYKELSQGVGQFGQNLRLTNADYEEYKGIISQVSDIMPDLTVRYNEQGEKIGFVTEQIEDLTDAYKEWQQTQAKKFIFEGDENGNTFQDVLDNYNLQTGEDGITSHGQTFLGAVKEFFTLGFANTFDSMYNAEAKKQMYENLRDFEGSRYDLYNDLMEFKDKLWMDDGEFKSMFGYLPDEIYDMTDEEFENWRKSLNGYIDKYQSEIDLANQKVIEGMKMLAMSSDDYWAEGVSENERSGISNFLSNMTSDMIDTLAGEDGNLSQGEMTTFVSKLTDAFANNGDTLDAFDSLMAEEFKNMSYAESTEAINGWISNLASSTGFDATQLKEMFGVDKDVMEPLRKIALDGELYGSEWDDPFGRLRSSHIEDITSMLTSSGAEVTKQAKALDVLGQSLDSFDRATGGELTRILDDLDSSDPESVKKYNEEIQNFFDTIKNSDQFGEEFSSVIGVLEDVLGDASVAFENFEAKYNNFLALAEKGDTSTGETAISKAIEVLKTGLEEGNVSSNLFNEALNLVFGDNRPSNLADALAEIELLFGSGENSANKLFNELEKFSTDGVVDLKKMREELNLSDATFAAFKEKLKNMGVILTNTEDMNRIGDGLGLGNDKVLQFESEAQALVKQFKDGTISIEKYNEEVKKLSENYGLASDSANDFERNMNFAATGKYRVADDEFGGNITSFLGIGGDVALEIESFIAQTQDQFKNAEITPDTILDTDSIKEDIRLKLRDTGEYTEAEIESLVSEIEKRVKTVRLETAIEAELPDEITLDNGAPLGQELRQQLKDAITSSFDSKTGTIDLKKLKLNISNLGFIGVDGGITYDNLMSQLGFNKDGDGQWTIGDSGIGKLAVGLSAETATQNLQGVIDQADELQGKLDKLNDTKTTIEVKHDDLANAEGQALSTKYTLQEMQKKGYSIPVTFTYTDKPKGFETETTTTGGDSEAGGNAFASGNAFGNGRIGAKKTETALGGELGQEIVVDRDKGTWRTIGDHGAEFFHINKGDIVFNAEQTKALLKNGRTNGRGKSYAGGTAYEGSIVKIPDNIINTTTTTTTTTTTKSTTSSSSNDSYFSLVDAWITENEKEIERLEREYESLNRKFESALDSGNKEQAEILRTKLAENAQTQKDILHQQNEAHRITQGQLLESLYQYAPELTGKSWDEISEVDLVSIENVLDDSAKTQFKGIVDDLKTIDETIKGNSDAWWDEDENIEDYYRSLMDFQEDYSRDWIDNQKAFDKMTDEEELTAYDRMIVNNENFIEQILADTRLSEEAKAVLIKEANDRIIDIEKDAYDKRKDIFNKATDFASSYFDSQKTLLQSHYDVTNSIAEAQHEINKELEASKTMYEYLDEDTRKLLFNQEDYNTLSKELIDIQSEADRLQRQYTYDLEHSTLDTIEEITSNYEMQYETLMKSYEIAKADLEVAKKKQKLNNVLNERNVRMLINGQWQWVANTQDVIDAQGELADAEYEAEQARLGKKQADSLNNLTAQQDELTTVINKFESGVIDLDTAVGKVKNMFNDLPSAIMGFLEKASTSSSTSEKSSGGSSGRYGNYGGVGYDRETNYMSEILNASNKQAVIDYNEARNAKIDGEGLASDEIKPMTNSQAIDEWKKAKGHASGTRYTPGGMTLLGEVEPEMYITNNGRLIPINQPTIGNLGAGGVVFNQAQLANLRSMWDLSNIGTPTLPNVVSNNKSGDNVINYILNGDVHIDECNNADDLLNAIADRFRVKQ